MKQILLLILITPQFLLAQQFVSLRQDPKVEKVEVGYVIFKQAKDPVWTAVADTMTSNNWRPQTMDAMSGVVFFQTEGNWGVAWGSNNAAVARFTTKKVTKWSTWQSLALQTNLIVKSLEPHRTEVRVSVRLAGCNGAQAMFEKYVNCKWEPLQSNGELEEELLQKIASKLPALSLAELNPPSKPLPTVVSSAREQIVVVQKLWAAFELEAPSDQILNSLIQAKASLQVFKESPESQTLQRFTAALDKVVQEFAAASKLKPEDRKDTLGAAQDEFAEAKKFLSNYQNFAQEVEPGSASAGGTAQLKVRSTAIATTPETKTSEDTKPAKSVPPGSAPSGAAKPPSQPEPPK